MSKAASLVALLVALACAASAHEFSAYNNVTWDSQALAWRVNDVLLNEVKIAAGRIALFNVTAGGGDFFISSRSCQMGTNYALSRKDGVTNNACTPPCVLAMKLTAGSYYYCSSLYPHTASGLVFAMNCKDMSHWLCSSVVGCGYDSTGKCSECIDVTTADACDKLSGCAWCKTEGMCLHQNSTACRAPIPRERAVASWIWLLITVCALVVLIAVVLTLFITEASFKRRWAALSKTDKDFAEIGRGTNDGLMAHD